MSLRFFWIILVLLCSQFINNAQPEPNPIPIWPDDLLGLDSWYPTDAGIHEPAAVYLEQVATIGRGAVDDLLWDTASNEIVVIAADGVWFYNAADIHATPRYADIPTRRIGGSHSTLSYRLAENNVVETFDLYTGEPEFAVSFQLSEYFRYLTVTPDGTRVINGRHAWATPFQGLELWDTTRQRRIALSPEESAGAFNQMPLITSDSRFMIGLSDDNIRIWDLQDGQLSAEYTSEISETWTPASMYLHPDNKTLILIREGDPFEVWDLEQGQRTSIPNPHMSRVRHIEFSEDGQMTATYDIDGQLVMWDSNMEIITDFMLDTEFSRFVIHSNMEQIAAVSTDHRVQLISTQDGRVLDSTLRHMIGTSEILGENIFAMYQDQLHIRDLPTGELLSQITLPANAVTMTVLPFRTMNLFDAVFLGTTEGDLNVVLRLLPNGDDAARYISIDPLATPANDARIAHIAGATLSWNRVAEFGNDEAKQDWFGGNFLTIDAENRLVFWNVRTHFPSDSDDDEAEPSYVFTPLVERQLFDDEQIRVSHITTHNDYLAIATSEGVYVWDTIQLVTEDDVFPIRHLRDPVQPRVNHLAWLDDTRLAYGGESGVVTIIDLADASYHAQLQTRLANIKTVAVLDSMIFASGCGETVAETHPAEPLVYIRCLNNGFSLFQLSYDASDASLLLASPELLHIEDRQMTIGYVFRYRDVILIGNSQGIIEVWGVPTPNTSESPR